MTNIANYDTLGGASTVADRNNFGLKVYDMYIY